MSTTPEKTLDEIFNLLRDGHAVDWRDLLMLIANMNTNLVGVNSELATNSRLTRDVADRLETHTIEVRKRLDLQDQVDADLGMKIDAHEKQETELFHKAIGGYRVLAWSVSAIAFLIVSMGGYILKGHLDTMTKNVERVSELATQLSELRTDHKVLQQQTTQAIADGMDNAQRMREHERDDSRRLSAMPAYIVPAPKRK